MEIKWNSNNLPQFYLLKSNFCTIGWQSGIKKNWKLKAVCRHTAELPIPYLIINCKSLHHAGESHECHSKQTAVKTLSTIHYNVFSPSQALMTHYNVLQLSDRKMILESYQDLSGLGYHESG